MRDASRLLPLLLVFVMLLGCSALRHGRPQAATCPRSALDPAPVWTAGASWDLAEERLLLLDPGTHSLIAFSLDGKAQESIGLGRWADLDYSVPLRFEALDHGYILGDPSRLLWLDRSLKLVQQRQPFSELAAAGVQEGRLNDFAQAGDALVAYADYRTGEEEWHRGLVRIDLGHGTLEPLFELPLDDPEFNAYYHYDVRPYLVTVGKETFFLRFSEPPRIVRVRGARLDTLAELPGGEPEPLSLHAWDGRLFLLSSSKESSPPTVPPMPIAATGDSPGASLQLGPPVSPRRWVLQEIDPGSGARRGRYVLPTDAERLRLVPGKTHWALIEESSSPNLDLEEQGETTHLRLLPASWFRRRPAAGEAEIALQCGEEPRRRD